MRKYYVYSKSANGGKLTLRGAKLTLYGYDDRAAHAGYWAEVKWYEMMGYKRAEPPQDVLEYITNTKGVLEYAYLERGNDAAIVELIESIT